MKCFWCINEVPEAAKNRVTCPLRYNPPQEFCTYEVNEEPGGGEEASITYSINENVSEKLSGKKVCLHTWSFLLPEVLFGFCHRKKGLRFQI